MIELKVKKYDFNQWVKAAGIRAVKTVAQTAVALIGTSTVMNEVNKANTLMNYRIDELTKKVEKHNNVVERMALQERETKAIWKRIDEIKEELEKESE